MRRHGFHGERLYIRWKAMRQRCQGKYAARGIVVDPAWDDYAIFRGWALANGYADHLTLDRIDNDGFYCPENCRWVTTAEQNRNKRPADQQRSRTRRIFRSQWPAIAERFRRGESVASVAAAYGVSPARMYEIRSLSLSEGL